jgi:hypothetical protein
LAAPLDPDAAEIRIWAEDGGCFAFDQAVVDESEDAVLIAVRLDDRSRPGVECSALLGYEPMTVVLEAPLGDRVVEHAAPDEP